MNQTARNQQARNQTATNQRSDNSSARTVFLCALVVSVFFILATIPQLPAVVASHFGADNLPNGAMSRAGYRNFMLLFTIGIPLLAGLPLAWLPARYPKSLNIPNRDYWLAPAQREATLAFLRQQGYRLSTLLVVFMALVHYTLLEANALQPPRLPMDIFLTVLLLFLGGMVWWTWSLTTHFRKPLQ